MHHYKPYKNSLTHSQTEDHLLERNFWSRAKNQLHQGLGAGLVDQQDQLTDIHRYYFLFVQQSLINNRCTHSQSWPGYRQWLTMPDVHLRIKTSLIIASDLKQTVVIVSSITAKHVTSNSSNIGRMGLNWLLANGKTNWFFGGIPGEPTTH